MSTAFLSVFFVFNDLTVVKSNNSVRHGGDFHIMCYKKNSLFKSRCKFFQMAQNLVAGFGVKVSGWFVRKKNCRFGSKSSCDCNTLLLTAGKLIRITVELIGNFQSFNKFLEKFWFDISSVKMKRHKDVFLNGMLLKKVVCLENKSDSLPSEAAEFVVGKV